MKSIEENFPERPQIYIPDPDHRGNYINVLDLPPVPLYRKGWDWLRELLGVEEDDSYDYDW